MSIILGKHVHLSTSRVELSEEHPDPASLPLEQHPTNPFLWRIADPAKRIMLPDEISSEVPRIRFGATSAVATDIESTNWAFGEVTLTTDRTGANIEYDGHASVVNGHGLIKSFSMENTREKIDITTFNADQTKDAVIRYAAGEETTTYSTTGDAYVDHSTDPGPPPVHTVLEPSGLVFHTGETIMLEIILATMRIRDFVIINSISTSMPDVKGIMQAQVSYSSNSFKRLNKNFYWQYNLDWT